MKNILSFFILFLFLFVTPLASAQTSSTTGSAKLQPLETRVMERKQNREDLQKLIREKKESMRTLSEERREAFKAKLESLKDVRKKIAVERLDLRLSTINQNATQRLSLAIEKLEKLLDKFSQRVDTAKTEGKDTAEADSAVLAAELAIDEAKIAVASQSAREYPAEIIDEATLKNTVGKEVSDLRNDLKLVHDVVKNAKQKVMDVARAVAKLRSMEKITTPSVTITPGI
jgi:vacuolar-type H+-ATPase subunit I/STV1